MTINPGDTVIASLWCGDRWLSEASNESYTVDSVYDHHVITTTTDKYRPMYSVGFTSYNGEWIRGEPGGKIWKVVQVTKATPDPGGSGD